MKQGFIKVAGSVRVLYKGARCHTGYPGGGRAV